MPLSLSCRNLRPLTYPLRLHAFGADDTAVVIAALAQPALELTVTDEHRFLQGGGQQVFQRLVEVAQVNEVRVLVHTLTGTLAFGVRVATLCLLEGYTLTERISDSFTLRILVAKVQGEQYNADLIVLISNDSSLVRHAAS